MKIMVQRVQAEANTGSRVVVVKGAENTTTRHTQSLPGPAPSHFRCIIISAT